MSEDTLGGDKTERSIMKERVDKALELADSYAQIDRSDHKLWVIDQMVRALLGSDSAYEAWVDMHCGGTNEDGERDYAWETGTPP